MSRHLYRYFNEAAVKRSLRCEWLDDEGGVTSRGEQEALALIGKDDAYNFPKTKVEEPQEMPTGALPPAQYQAGEDDSISTFRNKKAVIKKVTAADSYSARDATIQSSTSTNTKRDDASTIASKLTTTSKTTNKPVGSKLTTGITSELTTSISHMNSTVQSMQSQFVALMQKLDTMNNRVGALETVTPAAATDPEHPKAPSHPPEKEDGATA
jgi:hypothetical protein